MITQFNSSDTNTFSIPNGLLTLEQILQSSSRSVFFCYFAVVDPTGFLSNAVEPFAPTTISWNMLYSLGYLYRDVDSLLTQLVLTSTNDPQVVGKSLGDMLMRPLYSHYLDRYD